MCKKRLVTGVILITLLLALLPSVALAKGKPVSEVTNNLSFPAIAVDGFAISPLTAPSFTVPYAGDYPGLTADEVTYMEENGPWYPQKTTGNAWQADFKNAASEAVTYIDWGDNVESVNPKVRRPFRLEVTLYKQLVDETMTAYTMGVLEYPSSATELQGTNTTTYENGFATVVSSKPKFVIQYLGDAVPALTWSDTHWVAADSTVPAITALTFGPELNVGGKYVFGASSGGWKPTQAGYYRLTFYIPGTTGVDLTSASVANYADFSAAAIEAEEGDTPAATPVVSVDNNLTYVDVLVVR